MSVFFRRRGEPPATTIAVTITGSGDASYCYATINGTKQYSAGTHEVNARDTITFGVRRNTPGYGWVKIDGTQVLEASNALQTYDWIVPSGISAIEIAMEHKRSGTSRTSTITVTTA